MPEFKTNEAALWLTMKGFRCSADAVCRACRKGHIEAIKKPNPKGRASCWMIDESALKVYVKTLPMDGIQISQRELYAMLDWIRVYVIRHGFPPSLREIRKGCSISSTSVVSRYLRVLEELNEITITKNIARGIHIRDH